MCGLVGMVGLRGSPVDRSIVERMATAILHRGPDSNGSYFSGSVGLGFRRLAILDCSATGQQPMMSPDGQVILCFNGEIYNYVEIRKELEDRGHVFRSSGDTEVLLHAYLEWGRECLTKLNGMWAFLIYDVRERKLFGSRDRFGKKPLYYYRSPENIFFASEIKAILASGQYNGTINQEKVSALLLGGGLHTVDEDTHTFYTGIDQLPAGYAFELYLDGRFNRWPFWSLPDTRTSKIENPTEAFYDVFEDACTIRMRSDVPVGMFLSGGMDSTSILCCLSKVAKVKSPASSLSVFSFQSREYDESVYIRDTLRQTGVHIVQCELQFHRLWDSLKEMLWFQDEPVHSVGPVITYEFYRLASQHGIKVILTGGGADEYLAGYPNYFLNYWCSLLRDYGVAATWKEIAAYCMAREDRTWPLFKKSVRHLWQSELRRVPTYRRLASWKRRHELGKDSWFKQELVERLRIDKDSYNDPCLDGALKRSISRAPLPEYLRVNDRNSMAHSVEARAPFLDYRLVSFVSQLAPNWKMRGPWNKYVLREAMRGRIPESVRSRVEKWGFPVPTRQWISSDWREQVQDLLANRQMRERGIYNLATIQKDYELYCKGGVDISDKLFNVIQFELWSELQSRRSCDKMLCPAPL
jgi:asparagine synthase (glutamine-hydrolysing)